MSVPSPLGRRTFVSPRWWHAARWVAVFLILYGTLSVFLMPARSEPGYYTYDVPSSNIFNGCGVVTLWCKAGDCPSGVENHTASGIYNIAPATRDFNVFGWDLGVGGPTCL